MKRIFVVALPVLPAPSARAETPEIAPIPKAAPLPARLSAPISSIDFRAGDFHDEASWGGSMLNERAKGGRLWRPLVGIVVAYSIAVQSLLIAFAVTLPANAAEGASAFALCQHNAQGSPAAPGLPGSPGDPACSHCLFCFAGSQHALTGSPPLLFHRVKVAIVNFLPAVAERRLPHRSPYSIASPRGPPLPT